MRKDGDASKEGDFGIICNANCSPACMLQRAIGKFHWNSKQAPKNRRKFVLTFQVGPTKIGI